MNSIDDQLTPSETELLDSLTTPARIQAFLDTTVYNPEYRNRSVLNVLRDRLAHCFDGAVFAAAMLRRLGYPPQIIDLLPEPGTDDDHVLAIFRVDGHFGAVAKSNFAALRYREPVYRSLRELVMSYFDVSFNQKRERTLRAYTRPLNLAAYDRYRWMTDDAGVDHIEVRLSALKPIALFTPEQTARLTPVDERFYQSGMLGVNPAGLYKLEK
jgi:hypothetical protein